MSICRYLIVQTPKPVYPFEKKEKESGFLFQFYFCYQYDIHRNPPPIKYVWDLLYARYGTLTVLGAGVEDLCKMKSQPQGVQSLFHILPQQIHYGKTPLNL
jgi:hypothetical protein